MKKKLLIFLMVLIGLIGVLSILVLLGTLTASGGTGFLDLTNIVQYFAAGIAVISALLIVLMSKLLQKHG